MEEWLRFMAQLAWAQHQAVTTLPPPPPLDSAQVTQAVGARAAPLAADRYRPGRLWQRGLSQILQHFAGSLLPDEATAVITTHVIADVERIGDEVAILDRGRLLLHAPLEELRDHVRQVEIEDGDGAADFGPHVAVLGRARQGTTSVAWIKHDGLSDDELCRRLGPKAVIRNVGLEALYLAIAEHRLEAKVEFAKEVVS